MEQFQEFLIQNHLLFPFAFLRFPEEEKEERKKKMIKTFMKLDIGASKILKSVVWARY